MENTEKYTFVVDYTPKEPETDKYNLTPSESVSFGQMEKNLKKYAADLNAPKPLETLFDNIHRLNRLFITFGHPWLADSGIIQKACAWYLAYAKPTKDEARKLIETLNGFTTSTCYLAEWNVLINRMQEFLSVQEKELKRLFEYEKEAERKHKEWTERLSAEGIAYCMTVGKGEIYGVLYSQIEELYKVMVVFGIKEDNRIPTFRTVPWISKRINKEENEDTEIEYFIDINEIHSPELSFSEFVAVYRKLGDFLNIQSEGADLPRG